MSIDYFYSLHRHADGREWPARQFKNEHTALHELSRAAGEMLQFADPGARSGSFTLKRFISRRGRAGELLEAMLVIKMHELDIEMPSRFTSNSRTVRVEKARPGSGSKD